MVKFHHIIICVGVFIMWLMNKLSKFFQARYGTDQLNIALFVCWFVVFVADIFLDFWLFYFIEMFIMIYSLFRCLSKNIYKRQLENAKFMSFYNKVKKYLVQKYNSIRYHNKILYKNCPKCHAKLRMTRKHGKHTVKCPVCKNEFQVRIL